MQSVVKSNEISFILRRFKMAATTSHHVFIISGKMTSKINSNASVATRGPRVLSLGADELSKHPKNTTRKDWKRLVFVLTKSIYFISRNAGFFPLHNKGLFTRNAFSRCPLLPTLKFSIVSIVT